MSEIKIPGFNIVNRVSVSAQYTLYLRNVGSTEAVPPMRVTFTAETEKSIDLEIHQAELEDAVALFNNRVVMSVDNAMLLQYVEPKNGDTVQTLYASLKEELNQRSVNNNHVAALQFGDGVPTMTKMGIKMYITNIEPTLEVMCALILTRLEWATKITAASDAGLEATVSWGPVQHQLI